MMVACWFGLIKAGGIAVTTMPLLRAVELVTLIDKAKVRLAICDERLNEEMELAREEAADLERIVYFNGSRQLEGMMSKKSDRFENLRDLMRRYLHDRLHLGYHRPTQRHHALSS